MQTEEQVSYIIMGIFIGMGIGYMIAMWMVYL